MQKIEINTALKNLRDDIYLKPTDPIFEIVNDGGVPVFINNNYRLMAQQSFGLNMDALIGRFITKGYEVVMNTQYAITFEPPIPNTNPIFYALYIVLYWLNRKASFKQVTAKFIN